MKKIYLSSKTSVPIYKQLYDQIVMQIFNGSLVSDDILPSIRVAAKELKISVITVKKAWEELERNGYIHTIPGKGSYVTKINEDKIETMKNMHLEDELLEQLEHYKKLGLEKSKIEALIDKVYKIK